MRYFSVVLLAAAAALAGCGNDRSPTRAYVDGVLDAKRDLDRSYTEIRPEGGAKEGDRATEEDLAKLQEDAQQARRDVEELDPPPDLEDEDKKILAAFRKIERGTDRLVEAREAGPDRGPGIAEKGSELYLVGNIELEEALADLPRSKT